MSENIVFTVDDNIESEGSTFNFIDVGIHENVKLTEIKVDKSQNGNEFLAFTFKSPEGKVLTKTEWKPSLREGQGSEVLISKCKNQAKRVKHIMTKFMSVEDSKIQYDYDNWSKYASTVKAKLDPVKDSKLLRIKAIYDNNNYVNLPNYVPFVETMDVPKEESKLNILSSDNVSRTKPDSETANDNPFDRAFENDNNKGESTDKSTDDLPF